MVALHKVGCVVFNAIFVSTRRDRHGRLGPCVKMEYGYMNDLAQKRLCKWMDTLAFPFVAGGSLHHLA